MNDFIRTKYIPEDIIFVDGLIGTGKSILGPILASLQRVERAKMEHVYEYLCALNFFGKISDDAGISLMRLLADLSIYNSMISRDVNLRPFDVYGLLNNPYPLKQLFRLFHKDGEIVLRKIKKSHPIMQISTHQILPVAKLAFTAFQERLKMIEMVRHPLYLIHHWFAYNMDRFGEDPREFTLWLGYKGRAVPWFAYGWEEKYLASSPMDKIIYSIEWLTAKTEQEVQKMNADLRQQILFIPYENFVRDPWPYIEKIEGFLGTTRSGITGKVLKRQKCPRKNLSAGLGHRRYGWKRVKAGLTDDQDYAQRRRFVEEKASSEALKTLDKLSREYEKSFSLT